MFKFIIWARTQSHRMEAYAVAALLIGLFGFSHMLGYWPHSAQTDTDPQTTAIVGHSVNIQDVIWRIVFLFGVLGAAFLFYLGRRAGAKPKADKEMAPNNTRVLAKSTVDSSGIDVALIDVAIRPIQTLGGVYRGYSLLLKIRVTNQRPITIGIIEWKIAIRFGGDDIYSNWKPLVGGKLKHRDDNNPKEIYPIDISDGVTPLRMGEPHTGWVLFETFALGGEGANPAGAELIFNLRDSLNGSHTARIAPHPYIDKFESIEIVT